MSKKTKPKEPTVTTALLIKLDVGCGPNKKAPDWIGIDSIKFPGVDVVSDLRRPWPFKDGSVEEIHCSHCIEHFNAVERCHVYNEMYRVLKPAGKVTLIAPSWSSGRAYGDPTHQWPPISSFSFYYLLKSWRDVNAPHSDAANWAPGYKCDFDVTWGFSLHPQIAARNQEYQQFALNFYTEAAQDLIATLVKR
jgi:SAM-dependent methyltransferase